MMSKTTLLALLDPVFGELNKLIDSISVYELKYPVAQRQLEKEFDAIIAFIASGGRMGRSTKELHKQFHGMMDKSKIRERLNWLVQEKKIIKSVGAKYTNFYFLN